MVGAHVVVSAGVWVCVWLSGVNKLILVQHRSGFNLAVVCSVLFCL